MWSRQLLTQALFFFFFLCGTTFLGGEEEAHTKLHCHFKRITFCFFFFFFFINAISLTNASYLLVCFVPLILGVLLYVLHSPLQL